MEFMPLLEGLAELVMVSLFSFSQAMGPPISESYLAREFAQTKSDAVFFCRVDLLHGERYIFHVQLLRRELVRILNEICYPLLHG